MSKAMISIIRQDYETTIVEIEGKICNQLVGVGTNIFESIDVFYLNVSGVFYRFFIDEEILFWENGEPDEEEDLFDDQQYLDISSTFKFKNKIIKEAYKKGSDFSILFEDNSSIVLSYNNGNTFIVTS